MVVNFFFYVPLDSKGWFFSVYCFFGNWGSPCLFPITIFLALYLGISGLFLCASNLGSHLVLMKLLGKRPISLRSNNPFLLSFVGLPVKFCIHLWLATLPCLRLQIVLIMGIINCNFFLILLTGNVVWLFYHFFPWMQEYLFLMHL